jgi:hypothetical protein
MTILANELGRKKMKTKNTFDVLFLEFEKSLQLNYEEKCFLNVENTKVLLSHKWFNP